MERTTALWAGVLLCAGAWGCQADQASRVERLEERVALLDAENRDLRTQLRDETDRTERAPSTLRARQTEPEGPWIGDTEAGRSPTGVVIRGLEREVVTRDSTGAALVYIDQGRRHGVEDGARFTVFAVQGDGKRVPKGTVQARRVLDDITECRVVDLADEQAPIVKGDRFEPLG